MTTNAAFAALIHAQRHLWDEIRRAALGASLDAPYLLATRRQVVPITSLSELARTTRAERSWLGAWWPEDRR